MDQRVVKPLLADVKVGKEKVSSRGARLPAKRGCQKLLAPRHIARRKALGPSNQKGLNSERVGTAGLPYLLKRARLRRFADASGCADAREGHRDLRQRVRRPHGVSQCWSTLTLSCNKCGAACLQGEEQHGQNTDPAQP
jgi:hypothetical protein